LKAEKISVFAWEGTMKSFTNLDLNTKANLSPRAFLLVMFILVFAIALVGKAQGKNKPNMFSDETACTAALESGDFSYYAPVDLSRSTVNPIDGKTVFGVKLEADTCRHQHTMKGPKWVVQASDSMMRAHKDAAGNLVIFARNDCGNVDDTYSAPAPVSANRPAPNPTLAQSQTPVTVNVYNYSSSTSPVQSENYGGGGVAVGGIPSAAVYEYVNGCAVASISMGIRTELVVPICPLLGGGYYPPGYRDDRGRYQDRRDGYHGGRRPQPPRPIRTNPTPTQPPTVNTGGANVSRGVNTGSRVSSVSRGGGGRSGGGGGRR
jgi:uncharacterized membrane protein YgcG